jgi:ribosome-binding protein aMBF1 (putative translation factor)
MREVIRCRHCKLNQFMTRTENCRRCGHALRVIEIAPVAEPEMVRYGKQATAKPMVHGAPYDVGFAVRVLRQAQGMSQRDLAKLMASPRTYISKVENHKADPQVSQIARFAAALEVPITTLLAFAEVHAGAEAAAA